METKHNRILADTGQSGFTWENARKLGINLESVDTVVISHGHYDHAFWSSSYFITTVGKNSLEVVQEYIRNSQAE